MHRYLILLELGLDISLMDINLVKEVILTEQQKNGKTWLKLSHIAQLCKTKYGLDITKDFVIQNTDFRVYRTPNPLDIYIALAENLDTFHHSVIENLTAEPSRSEPISPMQSIAKPELQQQAITLKSSKKVATLDSCEALEQALFDILRDLGAISTSEFVEISVLTKNFYKVYRQPIKPLLNALVPGFKFVDFLQCSDLFVLEQINGKWTVSLNN